MLDSSQRHHSQSIPHLYVYMRIHTQWLIGVFWDPTIETPFRVLVSPAGLGVSNNLLAGYFFDERLVVLTNSGLFIMCTVTPLNVQYWKKLADAPEAADQYQVTIKAYWQNRSWALSFDIIPMCIKMSITTQILGLYRRSNKHVEDY